MRDGKHTIDNVKGTLTAGVADLDASLTNMNGNDFSHFNVFCGFSTGCRLALTGKVTGRYSIKCFVAVRKNPNKAK